MTKSNESQELRTEFRLQLKRNWNALKIGESITCSGLATSGGTVKVSKNQLARASSFLRHLTHRGLATVVDKRRPITYRKLHPVEEHGHTLRPKPQHIGIIVGSPEPTNQAPKTPTARVPDPAAITPDDFTGTQLAESFMAMIEQLKDQIHSRDKRITKMSEEMRELVEQNAQLERLYRKAQERITELNQKGATKTYNLAALQELSTQ